MRRVLYISMLALLSAFSAMAQPTLKVTEQNVERHGQNVTVTFKVSADKNAVKHGEKILVTPVLVPATSVKADEIAIGEFYVAGHQQQKIIRQKSKLRKDFGEVVFIDNGETYTFVEKIPYDTSLNPRAYELKLSALKVGCCSVEECLSEQYVFEVGPAMVPVIQEAASNMSQVREMKSRYPFLRMVGTDADGRRGVSVRFPVAKIDLDPEYSSNAKSLKDIVDAISFVLDDEWAELQTIDIAGYASPEGNARQNQTLSVGRAEALKAFIMGKFGFSEDRFNVTAGGEDWTGLRELVVSSDMPYKDHVLDIIDNVPQELRQAKLKALAGGRPYQGMLDVLYPQLRDACYISVWFSEKEDIAAQQINEAVEDVISGRYEAALEKLNAYKDDQRAWNALGSVNVLTENLKEARKWFAKAAKAGDADAAKNLETIEQILTIN